MEIRIGDRVRWECIDGTVRGEVVGFVRGADNWDRLEVELGDGTLQELGTRPAYLEMMQFKVIFRDGGWQKINAELEAKADAAQFQKEYEGVA
jgi:hypothetical protein